MGFEVSEFKDGYVVGNLDGVYFIEDELKIFFFFV